MPLSVFPKAFIPALCTERTMTPHEWVDLAADNLDVDGLEFYWGFVPQDHDEQDRLVEHVRARGLSMPMMCYSPDFVTPDRAEWRAQLAAQAAAIETTGRMGGSYCRVLSGQRRPDVSRADGVAMVAEAIVDLLPVAERAGVVMILENHYKDAHWAFPEFAQKMDVFLELLSAVPDHPNFGVNYDPSNALVAGDDPVAMLDAVKSRLETMHASDRFLTGGTLDDLKRIDESGGTGYADILQHGVIGQGAIDYDAVFAILRDIDFHGWISIEDGADPAVGIEHLRLSAEFLRRKMAEYGVG
ncbi:MAG: sugar phosphate isomerase/epimerase [Spirochaetaceae bacterium]|nr:MAG: sugar phosphate isomerase/epimerase [Spirochaetaceae bacterium]